MDGKILLLLTFLIKMQTNQWNTELSNRCTYWIRMQAVSNKTVIITVECMVVVDVNSEWGTHIQNYLPLLD